MSSQNNPFHGILLTNPEGEQTRLHEAKPNNAYTTLSPTSRAPSTAKTTLSHHTTLSPPPPLTNSTNSTNSINTPVPSQHGHTTAGVPPVMFSDGSSTRHHHSHQSNPAAQTRNINGNGHIPSHAAVVPNHTGLSYSSNNGSEHHSNISTGTSASASANVNTGTGVQFDSEDMERGRSRIKRRDKELYGTTRSGAARPSCSSVSPNRRSANGSKSRSRSRSRSRSLSTSRSRLSIREEEFLKWTVLRQDPSIRLYNQGLNPFDSDDGVSDDSDEEGTTSSRMRIRRMERSAAANPGSEDDSNSEGEGESASSDEEESDEEQVSDVEDDTEIDAKFSYDLGVKILPNYCISINEVLGTSKLWIEKYVSANGGDDAINKDITVKTLPNGYIRGVTLLTKGVGAHSSENHTGNSTAPAPAPAPAVAGRGGNTYILYMDLSSESIYALLYVIGTVITNGDTLYILHWESNSQHVGEAKIIQNINKLSKEVLHLFDCINAVIDDLDVIILSLTHPYPKHLLSEMIYGLKPLLLCCSLSMSLSGLQNFVCSVPTLVIRKKLKRVKRKGLTE